MYAVIQTGGKQYRVQEGDVLRVATLDAEAGKHVSFDDVLFLGEGDAVKAGSDLITSGVVAEVLAHGRAKKVEIFKKRRRKNSQRTQGHRQRYTSVRIIGIGAARVTPVTEAEIKPDTVKPVPDNSASTGATNECSVGESIAPAAKKPVSKSEDKE